MTVFDKGKIAERSRERKPPTLSEYYIQVWKDGFDEGWKSSSQRYIDLNK